MKLKKITVTDDIKLYHFFTASTHSISIFQKVFNIFCSTTSNRTPVNYINFLNQLSGTAEKPINFTLNEGNKIKEQLKINEDELGTI